MPSTLSSFPSSPNSIRHFLNPNPALLQIVTKNPQYHILHNKSLRISVIKLCASSGAQSPTSSSPLTGDILRNLAVSSVLLLGLGFGHRGFSASAAVDIPTPVAATVDHQIQG